MSCSFCNNDFESCKSDCWIYHFVSLLRYPKKKFRDMTEVTSRQQQCGICLESVLEGESVHMCSDKTHDGMCKTCALSYISNKIESAFLGSCPTIFCPCTHTDGRRRRLLDYKQWRLLVSEKDVKEYTLLADSILAYLCGGCHSLKSLQITSTDEQNSQSHTLLKKAIESAGATVTFDGFIVELNQFAIGELSVEEFYNKICNVYFSGSMVSESLLSFSMNK